MSMKSAKLCCWTGFKSSWANSQRWALAPSNFGPRRLAARSIDLHGMLAAGQEAAQLPPVPAELAELHQLLVGDESQRALAAGQPRGDVQGVVAVVLPPLAAAVGQFGGVGDVDAIDARRKRSMNHSTKGQASTAIHAGPGSGDSQASILPADLVLILSRLISPAASTAASVTVHLCRSTPTND